VELLFAVGVRGGAMAIVSAMETSGFGVSTDPQEPQKRLLSNISLEHVGHLIIITFYAI